MIFKTETFESPTGKIMIFAEYYLKNKKIEFKFDKEYYYPQDSKHMTFIIKAESFIKDNEFFADSIEEANMYLKNIGINHLFSEI